MRLQPAVGERDRDGSCAEKPAAQHARSAAGGRGGPWWPMRSGPGLAAARRLIGAGALLMHAIDYKAASFYRPLGFRPPSISEGLIDATGQYSSA